LTAAATAVAIWVAVPKPRPVQVSSGETAVDAVAPAPRVAAPSSPPLEETAAAERGRTGRADELQNRIATEQRSPVRNEPPSADRERPEVGLPRKDLKQGSLDAKTNAPALADSASNMARATTPAPGAAPAAAPSAAAQVGPRDAPAEAGARMEAAAAPSRMAFAAGLDVIVVSSNPATRFRLLPGGGVQRSADGGSTWRTEATGATETLRAGASPSPSVCWLVGGGGTVLLSIDGRTWRRVAFPESVDLLSVVAADQDNATVTTSDGRAFVTADGGQTWTLRPGL
jgi:hypothetical protein